MRLGRRGRSGVRPCFGPFGNGRFRRAARAVLFFLFGKPLVMSASTKSSDIILEGERISSNRPRLPHNVIESCKMLETKSDTLGVWEILFLF